MKERINKQRGHVNRRWNSIVYRGSFSKSGASSASRTCTVVIQGALKLSGRLSRHIQLLSTLPFVRNVCLRLIFLLLYQLDVSFLVFAGSLLAFNAHIFEGIEVALTSLVRAYFFSLSSSRTN